MMRKVDRYSFALEYRQALGRMRRELIAAADRIDADLADLRHEIRGAAADAARLRVINVALAALDAERDVGEIVLH